MKTKDDIPTAIKIFMEGVKPAFDTPDGGYPMCMHAIVGSVYICGQGNDLDLLCWIPKMPDYGQLQDFAKKHGWALENDETYPTGGGGFESLKRDGFNLLLVSDSVYFYKWITSAELCRALKLNERWQRVGVHRVIMDDAPMDVAFSGYEYLE